MSEAASGRRSAFDPAPAARLLAGAWRSGELLSELPAALRPGTLDEGYALQDRLIEAMDEPGSGWKLGLGSPAVMRKAQLVRPLIGRLLASRFHAAGATIELPAKGPVTVEFEIAFVLARDIAPDDPAFADARGSQASNDSHDSQGARKSLIGLIAEARCTFELVRSRFVDRRAVGWPSFAGDSVGFEALLIGEPIALDVIHAIGRDAVVTCNDLDVAEGLQGDERTDPFGSLAFLLAHARERGRTLKRGEIVTTGAAARPFDVASDARISAKWPGGQLDLGMLFRR
jgi:2-keto-4-pentenoate hydratase